MINGPVNIVRLEGSVGKIKKVVYIFMDFHKPSSVQKKCSDIRAVDVNTYFVEEFDKIYKLDPKMEIDFMFERGPLRPNYFGGKEIYMGEISYLFKESFKIDIETNKAQKSELFPNIRFHYTDVRDILIRNSFNIYYSDISPIIGNIYDSKSYSVVMLTKLFDSVLVIKSEFSDLYVEIYKTKHVNPKIATSLYSSEVSTMRIIDQKDSFKLIKKSYIN